MNENPSENTPAGKKNPPADDAASLDEQLVAYLDGELDEETSRRIESQLASDANVRRRLQSLEHTWELLDDLDAAPVGEPFTRTTLEMVALAAGEDLAQSRIEMPRRLRRRRLQIASVFAAATALGFLGVWFFTPDPNRQLVDNLPVLEQFEEYRQTGNIGFLRQLRDEKLFLPKSSTTANVVVAKPEDAAARRRRIERMSPDEKAGLARIEERFVKLTPEERQALRQLHDDLRNADAGEQEQLRAVMHGYCEWLKTLSSYSWAGLAEMSSGERLQWVKERIKFEQSRDAMFRLSGKDAETVAAWQQEFVARHKDDFRKLLKANEQKKVMTSDEERYRASLMRMLQAVSSGKLLPIMTDNDLSQLRGRLSETMRKQMEAKPPLEQWRMVMRWPHFHGWRSGEGVVRASLPNSFDEGLSERLADFFEKKLSPDQRDKLLVMPSDEMYRRLVQMYHLSRVKPPEGPARRPEGVWREKRQ